MTATETIRINIRRLLGDRSVQSLATESRIPVGTVYGILSGRRSPMIPTLVRLAEGMSILTGQAVTLADLVK